MRSFFKMVYSTAALAALVACGGSELVDAPEVATAEAGLRQVRETTYYAEPELITEIGFMIVYCDGRIYRTGSTSVHRVVNSTEFCPGP